MAFLPLVRQACRTVSSSIHMVIDNHSAHISEDIKRICKRERIILHYQPPYSPEFNSIETLWGIIKSRQSKLLNERRDVPTQQQGFQELIK